MTTPCETQAPERDSYRETIAALERRLDEVRGERDRLRTIEDAAREVWIQVNRRALPGGWEWGVALTEMNALRRALEAAAPRGDGR